MLCAALLVTPIVGAGQAEPEADSNVAGAWNVRWAQAIRVNRDAPIEIQRWGDAELVLDTDGTTVTGRWTTNVLEVVNWRVAGTFREGRLELEGTEHDSTNPELDIVERIELRARLEEGVLEGTIAMSFRGMTRDPAQRPLTARRASPGD